MSRTLSCLVVVILGCFAIWALAGDSAVGTKTGVVRSVNAQSRTFILIVPPKPILFTVDDSTKISLEGKTSTFDLAITPDVTATVSFTRSGEQWLATEIDVVPSPPK